LERTVEQLDQHVRILQNCLDVLASRIERVERFLERATNDETE
jgi:prefoldin subunit 5